MKEKGEEKGKSLYLQKCSIENNKNNFRKTDIWRIFVCGIRKEL